METCPSGSEGGRAQQCARPTRPIRAFDCRRSPGGRVGASRDGEQTCQPVRPCSVRTCSTYNFKGALRAPGPRLVAVQARAPRDNGDGCRAAQRPPIAGWPPEDRGAPGAGCLPLAPSGHVGVGAHSAPRPATWAARRNVSGGARDCKRGHPSGARILKPCVLAVKIARWRSRLCAIPSGL